MTAGSSKFGWRMRAGAGRVSGDRRTGPQPPGEDGGAFDRWYRQEHLAERVGLPGFLRGRRGVALRGTPRYFAFYEADGVEAFRSAAYLERQANPTDLTRQIMPRVLNFPRGVYRRRQSVGGSAGPSLVPTFVTLRLAVEPGPEASDSG